MKRVVEDVLKGVRVQYAGQVDDRSRDGRDGDAVHRRDVEGIEGCTAVGANTVEERVPFGRHVYVVNRVAGHPPKLRRGPVRRNGAWDGEACSHNASLERYRRAGDAQDTLKVSATPASSAQPDDPPRTRYAAALSLAACKDA